MTQKIRWGLVSTARINRRVIPAIRASARGELVAVASRDHTKGAAYAAEWHIPQVFDSYDALLASDQIDAVYISVPNYLHAALTIAALEAGKAVLCEKPFALTVNEVDQVREAAERTGGIVAEAFMYRHHPQTKIVDRFVRDGRLGEIYAMRGAFHFPMFNPENVRLKPELGGGSLWDVGVYPISFSHLVMGGPPAEVWGQQRLGASGVDMHFVGQLRYGDGRISQISSSFVTPPFTEVEIFGSEGSLRLTRPFVRLDEPERQLIFTPINRPAEILSVPEADLYQGEIEDMHNALLDGQPLLISLAETRQLIATVKALYRSARESCPIRL